MLKKEDVVVFDFDGTLSEFDSNVEFGKYCFRHSVRPWLYLPLMGVALIARAFNPSGIWWRQNMRRFITPNMVRKFSPNFIRAHLRNRFGWAADQVAKERADGHSVILVSASPDYLVPRLVRDMKFDAILCSRMDEQKPWKYEFLCWGKNKVYAMDEWAKKNKIIPHVVRSYSDSKSDMPMMEIADEQVWIDRKTGLRKTA